MVPRPAAVAEEQLVQLDVRRRVCEGVAVAGGRDEDFAQPGLGGASNRLSVSSGQGFFANFTQCELPHYAASAQHVV